MHGKPEKEFPIECLTDIGKDEIENSKNKMNMDSIRTRLRMKCKSCGHWNRMEVNKLFVEQETGEPKVKVFIPYYNPLKTETCKKCKTMLKYKRYITTRALGSVK